jgi:hypothetical protein
MGRVAVTRALPGAIAAAEALWYDTARWASFVDGFGHVASTQGDWPAPGARVVWDSRPGGRGRVVERSRGYEARRGQSVEVEDAQLEGVQSVGFAAREDGLAVTLSLEYRLKQGGPLRAVADALFIRRSLADSLRRTLARFAVELAAESEPLV